MNLSQAWRVQLCEENKGRKKLGATHNNRAQTNVFFLSPFFWSSIIMKIQQYLTLTMTLLQLILVEMSKNEKSRRFVSSLNVSRTPTFFRTDNVWFTNGWITCRSIWKKGFARLLWHVGLSGLGRSLHKKEKEKKSFWIFAELNYRIKLANANKATGTELN